MVCFLYFEVNQNKEGFERADRRHKKNSKNIAVVVDSIVCCHTAPACRKANALAERLYFSERAERKRWAYVTLCPPESAADPPKYAYRRENGAAR